jgi:hypothetical protein
LKPIDPFNYQIVFKQLESVSYTLITTTGFAKDVFNQAPAADTFMITTPSLANYGSLKLTWPKEANSFYIIELLRDLNKPADFKFITQTNAFASPPLPKGEYHIRIVYDTNKNGVFDPVTRLSEQAEKVILHNKILKISAKWVIEENIVD